MRDLSLHILDIAQNSVRAGAALVEIGLSLDTQADRLTLSIKDDGCGMPPELVAAVTSPFTTTRTTRPVGLGIPMLLVNAQRAGGGLKIQSTPGQGTLLTATMVLSHIDRLPVGDVVGTMVTLIAATPDKPDYALSLALDGSACDFDTRQIRSALEGVSLDTPAVMDWVGDYLRQEIGALMPEKMTMMEGIIA